MDPEPGEHIGSPGFQRRCRSPPTADTTDSLTCVGDSVDCNTPHLASRTARAAPTTTTSAARDPPPRLVPRDHSTTAPATSPPRCPSPPPRRPRPRPRLPSHHHGARLHDHDRAPRPPPRLRDHDSRRPRPRGSRGDLVATDHDARHRATSDEYQPTVRPTTVEPQTTEPSVAPTTVSPGGTAFTGVENVVPIGAIALMLMTSGSGLLWAGSRRKRIRAKTRSNEPA